MDSRKRWATAVPLALVVALPATLVADWAVAAEQEATGLVEEIIVTSRREAESQQTVPVAVTALTSEDIERIAPRTLRDIDGLMPNVFIGMNTSGPSAGAVFIRGIGYADIEKTQSPQVGIIVDGVFQGTSTGQLVDMFDVAQVEVNRGPQGVLFGKNTSGGTITITRVRPEFNEWGFTAAVQGGTFNEEQVKGRVNIPLIDDQLALKIGGLYKQRDGTYFDNFRSTDVGQIDYQTYTAALRWEPTETISATLTYDHLEDDGDIPPQDPLIDGSDPFRNSANLDEAQEYDVDAVGLQVEWDLGFARLSSITGYSDATDTVYQDFDGSWIRRDPANPFSEPNLENPAVPLPQLHTLRDQDLEQVTQELRLSGDIVANVSYTVGAYYYETEMDFYQGTNQVLQVPPAGIFGPGAVDCGPLTPISPFAPALCQTGQIGSAQVTTEDVTSYAAFASVNWKVLDNLELSFGARYINEEKDFDAAYFDADVGGALGPIDPPTAADIIDPDAPLNLVCDGCDNEWDDVITKFTATWLATDSNTLYASYSEGFRSGGFSNRANDAAFASYKPETAEAYEIGSKNDIGDRVRINLTAFYTEVEGGQFSAILTTTGVAPGTNTIINNGEKTEIWGWEVEGTFALSEEFTIVAMYGYQDNESDDVTLSSLRLPFNPVSGSGCNAIENPDIYPDDCPDITLTGGDLGRAPSYNYALSGVYARDFGANNLMVSMTVRGQNEFVIVGGATSSTTVSEDAYNLVDARASYQWNLGTGDAVRLSVVGNNLTDKEYLEQALPLGNGGFQGWATPRTVALELLWQR